MRTFNDNIEGFLIAYAEPVLLVCADLFFRAKLPWFKPIGYVDAFGYRKIERARYLGRHTWLVQCVDSTGRIEIRQAEIESYSRSIADSLGVALLAVVVLMAVTGAAGVITLLA